MVAEHDGCREIVSIQKLEEPKNRFLRANIATKDDIRYAPVGNVIENRPKTILVLFGFVVVAHFVAGYVATHNQFLPEMGVGEMSNDFPGHCGPFITEAI